MASEKLSANDLIRELGLDIYRLKGHDEKDIRLACHGVFDSQINKIEDREGQLKDVLSFFKTIWKKYDCEQISLIYQKFVKMEEALYGLERDEEQGNRYRDHSIHMFNCFAFGLRVISSICGQISEEEQKKLFKVKDEDLGGLDLPFGDNYFYLKRLFYMWTLISTFHDIAIPFQHMAKVGQGISQFTEEFGWVFTDPSISMLNFDSSQLHPYFSLITSLYNGKMELDSKGQKYARPNDNHYLTKLLGREFDLKNHGVMSGFFVWKTIEEIFLIGRDTKHPLDMKQFNTYTEYILNQDISRVALAISLHALGEDKKSKVYAKVFPIDFQLFPLIFLTVLSDELQEYLRWDGSGVKKNMMINHHPNLDIELNGTDTGYSVNMIVSFSLNSKMKDIIIEHANKIIEHKNKMADDADTPKKVSNLESATVLIGNSIKSALERKLLLGTNFNLKLEIFEDIKTSRYSENMTSKV